MQEGEFSLSIAGLDPSGGAGILSDVKTFESIGVKGFAVSTGTTFQNEHSFKGVKWSSIEDLQCQLDPLFDAYNIGYSKIGLIENAEVLEWVVDYLKDRNDQMIIVWDPILSASSGYGFHKDYFMDAHLEILKKITLITPNLNEIGKLFSGDNGGETGITLSRYCSVLLKGGHNHVNHANDTLYENGNIRVIEGERLPYEKHGTGCVFSAAIVAHLSEGYSVGESCHRAKDYLTKFLTSNSSLLGSHSLQNA